MFCRKPHEALSDRCTLVLLLQHCPGIVRQILDSACGFFVQLLVPSTPERRNGLEARDGQQPCRYRRAPFEPASLTPHVEKHLADHVLRGSLIANETNDEPKHPHVVACIQHLHCKPIAVRDSSDEHLVRCRLHFGLVSLVASDYVGFTLPPEMVPQGTRVRPGRLYRPWGFSVATDHLLRL